MSEYTPITGELRDAVSRFDNFNGDEVVTMHGADFDRMCDAIDSIHAQLERENAALKAELDRVLGEDERDGWIELPKDADGVPIRVGDTVEYVDDTLAPRNVTSINLAGDGWWVYINGLGRRPDKCRHATSDTWESIIEDAMAYAELPTDMDMQLLVARCKALCERTMGGDAE